jgi:hypothetical protein
MTARWAVVHLRRILMHNQNMMIKCNTIYQYHNMSPVSWMAPVSPSVRSCSLKRVVMRTSVGWLPPGSKMCVQSSGNSQLWHWEWACKGDQRDSVRSERARRFDGPRKGSLLARPRLAPAEHTCEGVHADVQSSLGCVKAQGQGNLLTHLGLNTQNHKSSSKPSAT